VGTNQSPVKLWSFSEETGDAYTTCKYHVAVNPEEFVYANCLAVTPDKRCIVYGSKNWILGHDIERPQDFVKRSTCVDGFGRGIVSAIATCPIRDKTFAIGSYNRCVGIYDNWGLCAKLTGLHCGVTFMRFSNDGVKLYAGTRGSGEIVCWDMRNFAEKYWILRRSVRTQQRIYFDLTPDNKYLYSAGTDGHVRIWNTQDIYSSPTHYIRKFMAFYAGCGSLNGISLHPTHPVFATASGQYHHACEGHDHTDDDSEEDEIFDERGIYFYWAGLFV